MKKKKKNRASRQPNNNNNGPTPRRMYEVYTVTIDFVWNTNRGEITEKHAVDVYIIRVNAH